MGFYSTACVLEIQPLKGQRVYQRLLPTNSTTKDACYPVHAPLKLAKSLAIKYSTCVIGIFTKISVRDTIVTELYI